MLSLTWAANIYRPRSLCLALCSAKGLHGENDSRSCVRRMSWGGRGEMGGDRAEGAETPTCPGGPPGRNPGAGALGLGTSRWFGKQHARGTCLTLLCSAPDTFWKNPQFLLSVWRPQEGRTFPMPCSVLVSLIQKPRHKHRNWNSLLAIGFYLFRVGGCWGMRPHMGSPAIVLSSYFLSSSPSVSGPGTNPGSAS